jgi:hypothetical protein
MHAIRPQATELADEVTGRPISLRRAAELGITEGELRGPFWRQNTRGYYLWAGTNGDDVDVRIAQAISLMPAGTAVGGWASLYLQGATDLGGGADMLVRRVAGLRRSRARRPAPRPLPTDRAPVLVSLGPGAKIRTREDIDVSRRVLREDDLVTAGDVLCVHPTRALVDLMSCQPAEEGLVSIDAYLRAGLGSVTDVLRYLGQHPQVVGARRIARLATLADGRARSCPESRLRWIWRVEAGFPRPHVNVPLFGPDGQLLGIPDLLDEQSAVVGEYDGSQHRALQAHTDDNVREEGFERGNLIVVRATAIDIFRRRPQLVARSRAARRDGLARDRSRDRWSIGR